MMHPKWHFTCLMQKPQGRAEDFCSCSKPYADLHQEMSSHKCRSFHEEMSLFPQQIRCCWGFCTPGIQYELQLFGGMDMHLQYLQQRRLLVFLREVSAGILIPPGFLLMP